MDGAGEDGETIPLRAYHEQRTTGQPQAGRPVGTVQGGGTYPRTVPSNRDTRPPPVYHQEPEQAPSYREYRNAQNRNTYAQRQLRKRQRDDEDRQLILEELNNVRQDLQEIRATKRARSEEFEQSQAKVPSHYPTRPSAEVEKSWFNKVTSSGNLVSLAAALVTLLVVRLTRTGLSKVKPTAEVAVADALDFNFTPQGGHAMLR